VKAKKVSVDAQQEQLIAAAASAGNVAELRRRRLLLLLHRKGDDDSKNDNDNGKKYTALHVAAQRGLLGAVQALLKQNGGSAAATMTTTTSTTADPLALAAGNGHAAVAVALLDAKFNPNSVVCCNNNSSSSNNNEMATTFTHALQRGHAGVVLALLEAKARVQRQQAAAFCPLFAAANLTTVSEYHSVVVALLAARADPNAMAASEDYDSTALSCAITKESAATCVALLDAKAKLHRDDNGGTELHAAASVGGCNVVRALLEANGALETRWFSNDWDTWSEKLIDLWDYADYSPLARGAMDGQYYACRSLLAAGACVDSPWRGIV
jgi:ankyrin repeat protein